MVWYQASKFNPSDIFVYETETKKIKKYIFDAIDFRLNLYKSNCNFTGIDKLLDFRIKLEKLNDYDDTVNLVKEMYAIEW